MTDSTRWPPKDYDGQEDEETERALQEEIDTWEQERDLCSVCGLPDCDWDEVDDDLDFDESA